MPIGHQTPNCRHTLTSAIVHAACRKIASVPVTVTYFGKSTNKIVKDAGDNTTLNSEGFFNLPVSFSITVLSSVEEFTLYNVLPV